MNDLGRIIVKVAGESGQGINSIGEILSKAIKNEGYKVFGYREYPSLIKGGYASYQIDYSDKEISSSSKYCDLLVCLSRVSIHKYIFDINPGGILLHSMYKLELREDELEFVKKNKIQVGYIDVFKLADEKFKSRIVSNIIMTGLIWKILGFEKQSLDKEINEEFKDKPKFLKLDLEGVKLGYEIDTKLTLSNKVELKKSKNWEHSYVLTGNAGIALGAVAAGVRAYYSYPMTPASSIHSYLAGFYHGTGMLLKQAEDEITAIQMTLGSMFMGTRALVGTSGGGFDLMTESVSLSGMTETPLVCILGQRPGPATGMPSWTADADLQLAIYSGHGEYPKCVIAISDVKSAFSSISHAFNIAEEFQIPVIVLTDKQIAEALYNIDALPESAEVKRGLIDSMEELEKLNSMERYELTKSGVSKRWLPGTSDAVYTANSDEHLGDGSLTEEAEPAREMTEKRMRKFDLLQDKLPEPELYGDSRGDVLLVGWGSAKGAVLDAIETLGPKSKVSYLHYEYMWPLKTEKLINLSHDFKHVILVENNYTAQLGSLIRQVSSFNFQKKVLKYNGRPFFIEDILSALKKII